MMGRQSRQTAMIFVDIESLIPETHLLRKIERMVSFNFIYDLLAPYYPATGRPSVDPVSMFKMLLIGYLYGIKSERRLVEEVQLNIAYRWFCGFELDDTIPNHSTFSKTRTRKWQQSDLFQKAFYEIVKQCIDSGLIDGEAMAADGSYIPANVSRESWIVGTPEYLAMMRLRKIWAEGSFSVLKREHCISRIRKRGILAATEECLLAAMALNLKRMVNAIFRYPPIYCSAGTSVGFSSFLLLSTGPILDGTISGLLQQPQDQGKAEGLAACNSQTASPFGCLNNFYFKILSNFWGSLHKNLRAAFIRLASLFSAGKPGVSRPCSSGSRRP